MDRAGDVGVEVTELTDAVIVFVRVQPGARRTEITGVHDGALSVRVAAPPVDGKANDALVAFLAKAFGVRRSTITIRSGWTGRRKRVRFDGIRAEDARATLRALLA